ncbi:hypothetical protein [Pseudochryseolinea flava]|uniref:Uncharacterized protein n=1 Tax=Pseudochryseolinea flava TaxID=2059302 RepID=A0A364XW27_9BACT|nr:hypothetical protein [Pseudochryseolinea flava]RAV98557.1 hypothetical protein DQQ10_22730 [Pseudochryseolinea flava]
MNTLNFLFTQFGFISLTVVFGILLLREIKHALARTDFDQTRQRRIFYTTLFSLLSWLIIISVLSLMGIFNDFSTMPPVLFIVLIVPLAVVIWLLNNDTASIVIHAITPHKLITLQVFRVFVEILLWALFIQGLLPEQMTFDGRNFDIISGLTAPMMAWLVYKQKVSKAIVVLWNVCCLALLVNIVTTAILSMPTPFRVFMNEPANTIVATFPFILLPGFLVPLAYTLHFFSLKSITRK